MNAYLLSNSYDLILYVSQLKTDKKTEYDEEDRDNVFPLNGTMY